MENNKNNKPERPAFFDVFKVLGILAIGVGVILIIVGATMGQGKVIVGALVPGIIMTVVGIPVTFIGFTPELNKASAKTARYLQHETMEEMSKMSTTSAKITSEAAKITARAIKEGLIEEDEQVYCKHCGEQIDADSTFCKSCGKKQ